MIALDADRLAEESGAQIAARGADARPSRAVVDSREAGPGDLFVGLRGERSDGGAFATEALDSGAWGVLVEPDRARELAGEGRQPAWVLTAPDPLAALGLMARAQRRAFDAPVVGITGSVGKTSTKDICAALLPLRAHRSPANHNTEVGLPLAVLAAPEGVEALVLEMAMRGAGQIAELCRIAEPDAGAITNVGPVHLEALGTLEAVAAAKAEILSGLRPGGVAIVPVVEPLLEPHLPDAPRTISFGEGGDVEAVSVVRDASGTQALVRTPDGQASFGFPFHEEHNLRNALCAIACCVAIGAPLEELADRAPQVAIGPLRGELVELDGDVVIVNDCYNANPLSMRAALDHLRRLEVPGRRIAVLGEMAELGEGAARFHEEVGAHARAAGVDLLIGVGELGRSYGPDEHVPDARSAADAVAGALRPGDRLLVKGSRSVGLESVAEALRRRDADEDSGDGR